MNKGQTIHWPFADGWVLHASWGEPAYRTAPMMVLYKASCNPQTGQLDHNRCTERLTPWDDEFAAKLRDLMAAEERRRGE